MNKGDPLGLCWYCVFDPFSHANPIYEGAYNDPTGAGAQFVEEADPLYGAISNYSSCRDASYSIYTCANMSFNPAAVELQTYSNCRNDTGASVFDCASYTVDPFDWALQGYSNEVNATRSGCGFWTSVGYGFQGAEGVGAGLAFAYGAGESVCGTFYGGEVAAPQGGSAAADASSVENAITSLSAGRSGGVYTVSSPEELQSLYNELSAGGTRLSNTYPGEMVELPDGTTVGLRETSASGGPTIDVKLPDGTQLKVHVSP